MVMIRKRSPNIRWMALPIIKKLEIQFLILFITKPWVLRRIRNNTTNLNLCVASAAAALSRSAFLPMLSAFSLSPLNYLKGFHFLNASSVALYFEYDIRHESSSYASASLPLLEGSIRNFLLKIHQNTLSISSIKTFRN